MIKTRQDLKRYIEADRDAQSISSKYSRPKFFGHTCWKFTSLLRKAEYHINNNHIIRAKFYYFKLMQKCIKLSTFVMPNTFGPGLCITHWGGIAISGLTKIGSNCLIHQCVTIGVKDGCDEAPTIGNGCNFGAGCVVLGGIHIADGVTIGANAVVTKSILEPNSVWVGIPCRRIK